MSLRDDFSKTQTNAYQKRVDDACAHICRAFARDRKILQQRAQGRSGMLGSWRKPVGELDEFSKKITYVLLSDTQAKSANFNTRMSMVAAIKKQLQAALDTSGYLRALHAGCAKKDVDVRIEISIDDHFVPNVFGTSYRQVDIKAVIHLDEPYARSSKKMVDAPPPLPPPPAAPPEWPAQRVVERKVRDPIADAALIAINSKDPEQLAAHLRQHGWSDAAIAKVGQQAPLIIKRVTIAKTTRKSDR